ncbi:FecR family protein [Runella sp. MFBS21]|uniref:FecR family protein n=1 Tax=Runella sp. MFBS21 TaxID=3034018 RepID=UPI0023F93F7B|nr:FecR family protein [Runella sp. MFBS21]MDF7821786.1 FecR family protein [Runella sp. MFBS21]
MSLSPNPFSVAELLEDETFQRWMKERSQEDRLFWEEWLYVYPEKREIYEQAVAMFLVIEGKKDTLSDQDISLKKEQILELISEESSSSIKSLLSWTWLRGVAAVIIMGVVTWYYFRGLDTPQTAPLTTRSEEKGLEREQWRQVSNTSQQPMVVLLPDNSSVVLSEGSSLRFQAAVNTAKREVFLKGEGFFEVSKDPTKPFFVYTNSLTTKVLGTSFQVRSFEGETVALVKVKSGRVAVMPVASPNKSTLLTPHQQLSIEIKTNKIIQEESRAAPKNPSDIVNQEFTYEYAHVSDILEQLQESYNMPIQYEREKLSTCTFTGQLNDLPFLEKIRLICLTIESTYQIIDNKVVIQSKGCN